MNENNCPSCGAPDTRIETVASTVDYRVGNTTHEIPVTMPVHTCVQCGQQFTSADAEDFRHDSICRFLGRMTPSEITRLRERYGLSKRDFARLTGFGEASIHRWESSEHIQSESVDALMRLLEHGANVSELAKKRGVAVETGLLGESPFLDLREQPPTDAFRNLPDLQDRVRAERLFLLKPRLRADARVAA